jgi:chromosome segregation ATPase
MDDRELITNKHNPQTKAGVINSETRAAENTRNKTIIYAVLTLLVWSGLFYGGYYYTSKYLQQIHPAIASQIEEVKLENQRVEAEMTQNMKSLQEEINKSNQEMTKISSELYLIREELELTGETLTGSDETRQSLQEQMSELDQQLVALKQQLEKLEEAVRAF